MLRHSINIAACVMLACLTIMAGNTVRPGLENIEYSQRPVLDMQLVQAIKEPLLAGKDVEKALQKWFDGRLLHTQGKHEQANQEWQQGLTMLENLSPLPENKWDDLPDAELKSIASLHMESFPQVEIEVVQWTVDKLKQYGLLMKPAATPPNTAYPLILYTHGAAFGVPNSFCGWLAELVNQGYVVIAPAMRGEPLFQMQFPIKGKIITCEGEIENLDGEVNDCLSMVKAAWKLPYVRTDEFAMVGHSFGAGVGLLAAARAGKHARAIVSYDAWLVNPQRFYWDRMANGANNWLSWADFCNQPVADQLKGLLTRSIVHNAKHLQCPMLLFMGGAYDGSVFHLSHNDLRSELQRFGKDFQYVLVPNGGHNFVLDIGSQPALFALQKQHEFLQKHFPPLAPQAADQPKEEKP